MFNTLVSLKENILGIDQNEFTVIVKIVCETV